MAQTGTLDHAAAAAEPRPANVPLSWLTAVAKAFAPWAVIIIVWEWAAAAGWSGAILFPPPSAFIGYAIESDFRIGFGAEAMTIPWAIVASALRVLAGLAIGFGAAIVRMK